MKSKLMKKMTMSYKENPLHTECKGDSQYITTIAFLHDTCLLYTSPSPRDCS